MFRQNKRTYNNNKLTYYCITVPGKVPKIFKVEESYQSNANSIITTKDSNKDGHSNAILQTNYIKSNNFIKQDTNEINPVQSKKSKFQCSNYSVEFYYWKYGKSKNLFLGPGDDKVNDTRE